MKENVKIEEATNPPMRWLLFIHQLPPKPAYLRVKVWRRLQSIGAVAVKNSVYVLPCHDQTREDFQWLLKEVREQGGDGLICGAEIIDGMRDGEVQAIFDSARDKDYAELTKGLRPLLQNLKKKKKGATNEAAAQIAKCRQQLAAIDKIDFFGAGGRMSVEALLADLDHGLIGPRSDSAAQKVDVIDLVGKTWVTRQNVHVDRIACAWLIRRFIDPNATFKFVSDKRYEAAEGELRYDMFNAEFTHEGDKCSFEVLIERACIKDRALCAIGEIVHNIDIKDKKFSRPETTGIEHVIAGICTTQSDDESRIARAAAILDDTYEQFRRQMIS